MSGVQAIFLYAFIDIQEDIHIGGISAEAIGRPIIHEKGPQRIVSKTRYCRNIGRREAGIDIIIFFLYGQPLPQLSSPGLFFGKIIHRAKDDAKPVLYGLVAGKLTGMNRV